MYLYSNGPKICVGPRNRQLGTPGMLLCGSSCGRATLKVLVRYRMYGAGLLVRPVASPRGSGGLWMAALRGAECCEGLWWCGRSHGHAEVMVSW